MRASRSSAIADGRRQLGASLPDHPNLPEFTESRVRGNTEGYVRKRADHQQNSMRGGAPKIEECRARRREGSNRSSILQQEFQLRVMTTRPLSDHTGRLALDD